MILSKSDGLQYVGTGNQKRQTSAKPQVLYTWAWDYSKSVHPCNVFYLISKYVISMLFFPFFLVNQLLMHNSLKYKDILAQISKGARCDMPET